MSLQLINRSPDLKKLRDEGYEVEIVSGYLVLRNIPYVSEDKKVHYADLISELTLAGDRTAKPKTHVVNFSGNYPCTKNGARLNKLVNGSQSKKLTEEIISQHTFSSKPLCGFYEDYYEKMSTYSNILSNPAQAINPGVTAKTFAVVEDKEEDTAFNYIDTASSRCEILEVTRKLEGHKIAIVGLGGTGSYILDLIAKTPVSEIHLYDKDKLLQHNAFRGPGAPSLEELNADIPKVEFYKEKYSQMHRGIVAHEAFVDGTNINDLKEMDFVFLCIDKGGSKKVIVDKFIEFEMPFIDVGMGIYLVAEKQVLGGQLRVTTSTPDKHDHLGNRISLSDDAPQNEYNNNIQIADLNSLNSTLAVIKWKKLLGFYLDLEGEHNCIYTIDGNIITNEDENED